MATKPIPQLAEATALTQLIAEYPDLPHACWSIDQESPGLRGALQDSNATFEALHAWASVLGGSIRPGIEFPAGDVRFRTHELLTTWRDVKVRVAAFIPLPVSDVYLTEGRSAEWDHQQNDEAEPPLFAAFRAAAVPAPAVVTA